MIEKYKEDKNYRNKIKLIGYGIFIIIAIIFAMNGNNTFSKENIMDNSTSIILDDNDTKKINLFDNYTYNINVSINDNNYIFSGKYNNNVLTILKEEGDNVIEYQYRDNNYYLVDTNEIVNEDIYNPVDSKYLDINLINQYLNISKYEDNEYKVYLKDIILGNQSNDYITINYTNNLNEINIIVDYTKLLKYFNNNVEKYIITMKYNKIID